MYRLENGKCISKTTMGVAFLMIPFFLLEHFYELNLDTNTIGFENSALNRAFRFFYGTLGILILEKTLKYLFFKENFNPNNYNNSYWKKLISLPNLRFNF